MQSAYDNDVMMAVFVAGARGAALRVGASRANGPERLLRTPIPQMQQEFHGPRTHHDEAKFAFHWLFILTAEVVEQVRKTACGSKKMTGLH